MVRMKITHELITDTHWGERGSLILDWGGMSAYLLRIGEYVYACTFCEPRWFLWRRDPAGTWERGASGPMLRTPLLLAGPEGHIHIISAGVHWTSREPGGFRDLKASELPQPCGTMIYVSAAINTKGDILLVFVNPERERQLLAGWLPAGAVTWQVRELATMPVRYCYPQIHLTGRQAHVFIVEDERVSDPAATWGNGQGFYYRFRELHYLHSTDVPTGGWSAPVPVARQDDGFMHTYDILSQPDDSVHLLWWAYDRSVHGAPAPDATSRLVHSIAAEPGAPFTHQIIADGTARAGNFRPDGKGGWHYLYGDATELRRHPYVGYDTAICRLAYRHRDASGALSAPVVLPTDGTPSVPHLLRPGRYGGDALPNSLEALWEDPWLNGGASCWRAACYTRVDLPRDPS